MEKGDCEEFVVKGVPSITRPLSNDDAIMLLQNFTVSYGRKVVLNYQPWDFSQSQTVSFLPYHNADMRRDIIRKVSEFVRIGVLQDIVATLPEIERTVGAEQVEELRKSLGLS